MHKPVYCCECGDKIDRTNWNLFTSRRYCELCETEFKFEETVRRISVVLAVLIGIIGIGSYYSASVTSHEPPMTVENLSMVQSNPRRGFKSGEPSDTDKGAGNKNEETPKILLNQPSSVKNEQAETTSREGDFAHLKSQKAEVESVSFCGAQTKKGSPCSRRVKGGGRCWQHLGSSSILPENKLRIR